MTELDKAVYKALNEFSRNERDYSTEMAMSNATTPHEYALAAIKAAVAQYVIGENEPEPADRATTSKGFLAAARNDLRATQRKILASVETIPSVGGSESKGVAVKNPSEGANSNE